MMKSLGLDMPVSSKKENGGQQNSQEDGIGGWGSEQNKSEGISI